MPSLRTLSCRLRDLRPPVETGGEHCFGLQGVSITTTRYNGCDRDANSSEVVVVVTMVMAMMVGRKDEQRDVGLGPEHDWSSHCADAFGLMATHCADAFGVMAIA
jgi:hypothetical protein